MMMMVAVGALGDSCPHISVPGEGMPWPGTGGHRAGSWTPGVCALMHQDSLQIPGWRGAVAAERARCRGGGRAAKAAQLGRSPRGARGRARLLAGGHSRAGGQPRWEGGTAGGWR